MILANAAPRWRRRRTGATMAAPVLEQFRNPDGDMHGATCEKMTQDSKIGHKEGDAATAERITDVPVEGDEVRCCRICHGTDQERLVDEPGAEPEPLIEPCQCSGSIGCVHSRCLIKWLNVRSRATQNPRCDLCRARLRVVLGGGQTRGVSYLMVRLNYPHFDAPGWISALLMMMLQMHIQVFLRCFSCSVASSATVLHMPQLNVPLAFLELAISFVYACCVLVKGAIVTCGSKWTPQEWGVFGVRYVAVLLDFHRTFLTSCVPPEFSEWLVSMIIVLVLCVTLKSVGLLLLFGDVVPWTTVLPGAASVWPHMDKHIRSFFVVVSYISMGLNTFVCQQLLKRAFLDKVPIPVRVLSRSKAPDTKC